MARYVIRTSQYCALCKEIKFQKWLNDNCPEEYKDLIAHLKLSTSCKSNTKKMMEIQNTLRQKEKLVDLVKFLLEHFPITIDKDGDPDEIKEIEIIPTPGPQRSKILLSIDNTLIFKHYNPNLLSFPQKLVMQNADMKQLELDTKEFISTRLGTDWIIINDKAYIEYFTLKYHNEVLKITPESREIYKYKLNCQK
jgi:hypothetical protein